PASAPPLGEEVGVRKPLRVLGPLDDHGRRSCQYPAEEVSVAPSTTATSRDAALARDHLANERTYLAWLRTATNVMILGLPVATLIHAGPRADVAGGILTAVGFVVLVYGTLHTRRITHDLRAGRFEADYGGPLFVAGLVTAGVAAAAILLFA